MTEQPHPTFGKWFQRFFFRAVIVATVLFAASLFFLKNEFHAIGWCLAIFFGLTIVGTMVHLTHRLYNVECPKCGRKMKTAKNSRKGFYIARCPKCESLWNLEVGIGDSSS
ncbi:MAG: zf-TFIIB domain-containing protein [Betaproteobacteria bacterium]